MSTFRRRTGWTFVALSLALHLFTVFCFVRQPDRFAAFTVLPIWVWGGFGLMLSTFAFYFLRAPLSLIMTAVWAVTLLAGADEARVLANIGTPPPLPGPAAPAAPEDKQPVLRVITMNCATFLYGSPAKDLAAWHPDVVLLQDAMPYQVRRIADELYGGLGDYRAHQTNGIVTRWKIQREVRNHTQRNQRTQRNQQVTIERPDFSTLEVVNVHLATAATDLRFWQRSTWTGHRVNRAVRAQELSFVLQVLEQTTAFPDTPTILGGDFNAPASDVVHRQLPDDFTDTFAAVGTGWGDTFQRRLPILRIDHLYTTPQLTPIRCRVVTSRHSDHRMVVADYLFK